MAERTTSIRLSGRGGQGVMTAGFLLAQAGMLEGMNVVQTQSYGPEARLGAAKSDVILATGEIAYPQVVAPDILLCLSTAAYQKYGGNLASGGTRIVDETVTWDCEVTDSLLLPIVETAEKLEAAIAANVVSLGVMIALHGLVGADSMRETLHALVKPQHRELNARAFDAGLELGASVTARS